MFYDQKAIKNESIMMRKRSKAKCLVIKKLSKASFDGEKAIKVKDLMIRKRSNEKLF
jgi:hypothetical protein